MRIALVTPEYPPGVRGGICTYAGTWARMLVEAGHTVHVVTKLHPPELPEYEREGNLHVHRVMPRRKGSRKSAWEDPDKIATEMMLVRHYAGLNSLFYAEKLREIIADSGIDIIEGTDTEGPLYFFLTRQITEPDFPQVPVVNFVHSTFEQCERYNDNPHHDAKSQYRIHMEDFCISAGDAIVVASDAIRREVIQQYGAGENAVFCCPLPTLTNSRQMEFRAARSPEGTRVIMYAGRLERRKGVDNLVRAAVPLMKKHGDLQLRLAGRDTDFQPYGCTMAEWIKRYVPADLVSRVEICSELAHSEVQRFYGEATVVVLPSRWEPFGLVCQEAMAQGALVACTRGTGFDEMLRDGENGLTFPGDNVPAIRETIERALSMADADREKLQRAAFETVRKACSRDEILQRRIAHYEKVISDFKRRPRCVRHFPSNIPMSDVRLAQPHPKSHAPLLANPKVSVIVPCYNLGEYLGETVESVLKQTYRPHEIIIVDDGSTDAATIREIDRWAQREKLVKVVRTSNQGLCAARNTGAAAASGNVLCFLDADDWLSPGYFSQAVYVMEQHPEVGAVSAWADTFGMMNTMWAPPHAHFPELLVECMSTPPAVIRRDAYDEVGGFAPQITYAYEDWDFWIGLCGKGWVLAMLAEGHIHYRMRPGSMSREFRRATVMHGRRLMAERHRELYRRYGDKVALLSLMRAPRAEAELASGTDMKDLEKKYAALEQEVFTLRAMVGRYRRLARKPWTVVPWMVSKLQAKAGSRR